MSAATQDVISMAQAGSLAGLFQERVRRTPTAVAYRYFDASQGLWRASTWGEMAAEVGRWQQALAAEGLAPGARVAVMLRNSREWVLFEQAALGLGLVVVPLYTNDRADNAVYVMRDAGVSVLLLEGEEHWTALCEACDQVPTLQRVVVLEREVGAMDKRLAWVGDWLPTEGGEARVHIDDPHALATIVYTSGTTGPPKGVMLSHHNILWNTHACLQVMRVYPEDNFLSFLPLSHTLERTAGYYLPMMAGACVSYARSIPQLAEDLLSVRPTVLISVPRIFERIEAKLRAQLEGGPAVRRALFNFAVEVGWRRFEHAQGRASRAPTALLWPLLERLVARKLMTRLGGRLRLAVSGGAPLSAAVARVFIGLGLPLIQGYGLTETSPVISANRLDDNDPASVGPPLPDVRVRIAPDGELLVQSPGVCAGYWHLPEASAALIDDEGWLHTGDKACLKEGRVYITGRLKEIIVLANGEKVPPADMEAAILRDSLFEQVLVLGEGRPYLSALAVLEPEQWRGFARTLGLDPATDQALGAAAVEQALLTRIAQQLHSFPGYAQIRRVSASLSPWVVENGLLTPTLKMRRERILEQHGDAVEELYRGH